MCSDPGKKDSKDEKASNENDASFSALSLAWELGYVIAVPLVALALLGRFLDKTLGTAPLFLLVGIIAAIIVSSYMVYKKTMDIINRK